MTTRKRYIISSFLTFLTGFLVGLLDVFESAGSLEDITIKALISGVVLTLARASLKGTIEYTTHLNEKPK